MLATTCPLCDCILMEDHNRQQHCIGCQLDTSKLFRPTKYLTENYVSNVRSLILSDTTVPFAALNILKVIVPMVQLLVSFYRLPRLHHEIAPRPLGDNVAWEDRLVKTQDPSNGSHLGIHMFMLAVYCFISSAHCDTQLSTSSRRPSATQTTHLHHPFNQISVYLTPAFHLLPPSTPF